MTDNFSINIRRRLAWGAALLLPIGIFVLLITIQLPDFLPNWLFNFGLYHFGLLVFCYALAFRLREEWSWIASGCLTALIFALPLAHHWSMGTSNANIIAGFIPYKDGFYYYNGAQMLLAGRPIGADGLQGAFRPLLPGLISVMLMITNHNLMAGLAIRTILLVFSCLLAGMAVRSRYGALPAAFFITMLYAFIRPLISYSLTEIPSLAFSCLSLILLLVASEKKTIPDLALGSLMLVVAISVRAGPFFMLPMLAVWAGWLFRKGNRFNLQSAVTFFLMAAVEFSAANMIFPRLVTSGGSSTFGNFSWMLYGQVVGGAGWNYHFSVLGTHDAATVMQAALERLRAYPQGLLIGSIKAYRDFFFPGQIGIFHLISSRDSIPYYAFWIFQIILMLAGLAGMLKRIKEDRNALLVACFAGILLSIPFLPPIDGGNRFYSGCAPFLFSLQAYGIKNLMDLIHKKNVQIEPFPGVRISWIRMMAFLMAVAVLVAPIIVMHIRKEPALQPVDCPSDLLPVAFRIDQGDFADILPDSEPCGKLPNLCLTRFEANGIDKNTDDFFRKLISLASESKSGIRIAASVNLVSNQYGFAVIPLEYTISGNDMDLLQGCADQVETEFQRIFLVRTREVP